MSSTTNIKSTPLMRQYQQVKARYPDTILLFRMGDFYETFDDDAKVTSKILGITLTKRGNGNAGETPLAGFPYHALDNYLPKLLKAGKRVAICEQLEDPKFAKGIVKRDVIEVVTPGVSFSEKILETKQNNYLASVYLPSPLATSDDIIGFAFVDVSTAEFGVSEFPLKNLKDQIQTFNPAEILVQKRDIDTIQNILKESYKSIFTKLDDWIFNYDYSYELLITHLKTQSLKGFGIEGSRVGIVAAGAVLNYLQETQKANLTHIKKIFPHNTSEYITLDPSTKRNLEITKSIEGKEEGTLFWVLDKTKTPMGGRLLKRWIIQPLLNIKPIQERLEAVGELVKYSDMLRKVGDVLLNFGDLERLIAKVCTGRANPREMIALKNNLMQVVNLKSAINKAECLTLSEIRDEFVILSDLIDDISKTINDEPPLSLADGGVIKKECNSKLDELRDITLNGKSWIANLQLKERERTGINSLKVAFNNVFGYYIEVTNTHKDKIPSDYIRKQTISTGERFITPELKEYEEKILNAEEKIVALETEIFNELRLKAADQAAVIQKNAQLAATIDALASLAETAVEQEYTYPEIDDGNLINIIEGRHPVIERLLPPGDQYTPNDTYLLNEENQILIITGPNMSGKSSYLRQVGLIVLLAQIGSFVPAKKAHIGIVDKIYTRVGASDNIASGESTFLVEMHEAAHIVNTATPRSLILLDEVGRGTSTFDGISIAWALTEHLHNRIGAKTLFATHYHELNELADLFPRIKNYKVDVREYGDKVIFLHKVTPGFADHSYGIQVAQMAGLPEEVTDRAKKILKNLEGSELILHDEGKSESVKGRIAPAEVQLTLFEMKDDKIRDEIKKIDIDKLTPLDALKKLAELKKKVT
ncbi:MAG: DNA mismatch repair protein MutS [Bacteroidota bacterium]|nr:DNA mismatch repair protein MutS [Bacteroidota bacterium]